MSTPEKPRRLGRGLEALLGAAVPTGAPAPVQNELRRLKISEIRPNPYQPRKEFRPEDLADLESSIKASGLLQPITVRSAPNGNGYELIAGERRLRAATRLGWTEIAAVLKETDDATLLTLALVENLQRSDLNPIEEAEGYQRLIDEFGLTQQQVSDVVGKDRSTVANILRILALPAAVRRMIQAGQLTMGHARPLLALKNESAITTLAREVVARGLTVREVEKRIREEAPEIRRPQRATGEPAPARNPEVRRIEDRIRRRLQTDVVMALEGPDRGEIRLRFYNSADLERLLELLVGPETDE